MPSSNAAGIISGNDDAAAEPELDLSPLPRRVLRADLTRGYTGCASGR